MTGTPSQGSYRMAAATETGLASSKQGLHHAHVGREGGDADDLKELESSNSPTPQAERACIPA